MDIRSAVLAELTCRTSSLLIAALVEDYGPEVKEALKGLRRERKVRLEASGCLAMTAKDAGMSIEELKAGSIEGDCEWFVMAELRREE